MAIKTILITFALTFCIGTMARTKFLTTDRLLRAEQHARIQWEAMAAAAAELPLYTSGLKFTVLFAGL